MDSFDYVIVGSGPAGCVLANRLTADPSVRIALLEAGPQNRHYLIDMPKGFGRLLVGSKFVTHYQSTPAADGLRYVLTRGKTLGGSTSVNGMAYTRGQPEDYDGWEALGATGWGWKNMLPAFRAMEDHELGSDAMRGTGGPLHVGVNRHRNLVNDAALKAALNLGLPNREDLNREDQVGIGPMTHMIKNGRRFSAANAFLDPVRHRPNLTIIVDTTATKILFTGNRVTGVLCLGKAGPFVLQAKRELIISAGAFETPKLLMLSGIGPPDHLAEHGIQLVRNCPAVGQNLAEHRGIALQFLLSKRLSHNPQFSGYRLYLNGLKYFLLRQGLLSYGVHELLGFAKVMPQSATADVQFFISPFSRVIGSPKPRFEKFPGANCLVYPTRPTSRGTVRLGSPDPGALPVIEPRALDTEYDRAVSVAMVAYIRRLFATEPLASFIAKETFPGDGVQADDAIVSMIHSRGSWGFHSCGTARMGDDEDAVVDSNFRVRGVRGLRVIDASVFPAIVSSNTTAPVAAMAWRAADLIMAGAE